MRRGTKHTAEQIVHLQRQVEVGVANGKTSPQACKADQQCILTTTTKLQQAFVAMICNPIYNFSLGTGFRSSGFCMYVRLLAIGREA